MTTFFQGTNATFTVQWPASGPPADVTGQTITIIRVSDAAIALGPTAVGINHLATGLYSYIWAIPAAQIPGDYVVVWNAIDAALDPVQASEVTTVANTATASIDGPCFWENIDTSCCADFWGTLTAQEQANAKAYASLVLWARTGRQYDLCPVTVRPCGRWCTDDGIGGWYWGGGMFLPYIVDGTWRNCWCGCDGGSCCTCQPSCQVYLPGPVGEIISVTVDGVVIDPATYRVDDGRWLVRVGAGNCWPDCQDFDVITGAGTFFVTYTRGDPVPGPLLVAAGTLACEWAKACRSQECRLTPYIIGLSRQGVDFTAIDPMTLLDHGFTGLFEVDSLIAALNPHGLTHRMRLLSPDIDGPRVTTWP
jgi:hypothetical protein